MGSPPQYLAMTGEPGRNPVKRGTPSCLLVIALAIAAVPSAAQTPSHPMDALTAREYWTVFEVLKASGRVNADTRFPEIGLQEPPKAAVLAWTKGAPLRREARVVVRQGRSVFQAVVDISGRKLASWNKVEGVQAAATEEEDEAIGDIVKANAEWQAAMRLRGITDFETVDCWGA